MLEADVDDAPAAAAAVPDVLDALEAADFLESSVDVGAEEAKAADLEELDWGSSGAESDFSLPSSSMMASFRSTL